MKILITGSRGQVGSSLVEQLKGMNNVELTALDRTELDITDAHAVKDLILSLTPDVIINAAAHTAVDRAEQEVELSYAINRDGPANLAHAANIIGAAILHISTDYVFAGDGGSLYSEIDVTGPQGVYGQSKLAGEIAVAEHCERHVILRTAWVFSEHGGNFVKSMLRLAGTRDELGIVGDQFGGPTYAGDIASALIYIANQIVEGNESCFGTYHYSGLPHVSWYEFAREIFKEASLQGILNKALTVNSITTSDYPTPAKRPANSRLNTDKIYNQFGIEASNWRLALKNLKDYVS